MGLLCRSQTHFPFHDDDLSQIASKDMTMLKVFTDFNARTSDGVCWNLQYDDIDLEKRIDDLKFAVGDKVRLFQDE
jgi:hypothetical protein